MAIGSRLAEERTRLGLNQTEFGALGGVTKTTQGNYEKDERSPDAKYLAAIAAAGVDVLYVVTGVRTPPTAESLTPEQSALLDNYEHADEDGRAAARRVLNALAQLRKKGA